MQSKEASPLIDMINTAQSSMPIIRETKKTLIEHPEYFKALYGVAGDKIGKERLENMGLKALNYGAKIKNITQKLDNKTPKLLKMLYKSKNFVENALASHGRIG